MDLAFEYTVKIGENYSATTVWFYVSPYFFSGSNGGVAFVERSLAKGRRSGDVVLSCRPNAPSCLKDFYDRFDVDVICYKDASLVARLLGRVINADGFPVLEYRGIAAVPLKSLAAKKRESVPFLFHTNDPVVANRDALQTGILDIRPRTFKSGKIEWIDKPVYLYTEDGEGAFATLGELAAREEEISTQFINQLTELEYVKIEYLPTELSRFARDNPLPIATYLFQDPPDTRSDFWEHMYAVLVDRGTVDFYESRCLEEFGRDYVDAILAVNLVLVVTQSMFYLADGVERRDPETGRKTRRRVERFANALATFADDCDGLAAATYQLWRSFVGCGGTSGRLSAIKAVAAKYVPCVALAGASTGRVPSQYIGASKIDTGHFTTLLIPRKAFKKLIASGVNDGMPGCELPVLVGESTARIEPWGGFAFDPYARIRSDILSLPSASGILTSNVYFNRAVRRGDDFLRWIVTLYNTTEIDYDNEGSGPVTFHVTRNEYVGKWRPRGVPNYDFMSLTNVYLQPGPVYSKLMRHTMRYVASYLPPSRILDDSSPLRSVAWTVVCPEAKALLRAPIKSDYVRVNFYTHDESTALKSIIAEIAQLNYVAAIRLTAELIDTVQAARGEVPREYLSQIRINVYVDETMYSY